MVRVRVTLKSELKSVSDTRAVDYEGVGINSRTVNSKQAASELSSIFQNHYPEFLVRAPSSLTLSALTLI